MSNKMMEEKPIVYSCSGCSSAAQMANYIALQLDRNEIAEMSCIAGVGGNVKKLVRTAKSGRKIIAIDGCPLACSKACLNNHGIVPDKHFELTRFGVSKKQHQDFDMDEAARVLQEIESKMKENVPRASPIDNCTSQVATSDNVISTNEPFNSFLILENAGAYYQLVSLIRRM